jgi:hypothetical protein
LAPVFKPFLMLANLLLNVAPMVTTYQIQTGQHSGSSARLDWVHVEPVGDGVTVRPPNRFGRGLHVRMHQTKSRTSPQSSPHTSEANASVR